MSDELIHIVVDTETLGLYQDAAVLSIGAVAFKFESPVTDYSDLIRTGFHVKFNMREQLEVYKRKITESTMEWWKDQSPDAKKILKPTPQDSSMADGLRAFNAWMKRVGYDYKNAFVWSRGTYFDFPKLEHMYMQSGVDCGYNGWKIRDVRTYIDVLLGTNNGKWDPQDKPRSFIAHDALHDAAMDAHRMQLLFCEMTQ